MKRTLLTWILVFAGLALIGSQASAQYYPPGTRAPVLPLRSPARYSSVSPYLNLVRDQNNAAQPAINYYLGTVPEQVNRANAQSFANGIANNTNAILNQPNGYQINDPFDYNPAILQTGHSTTFLNTGGYFPNVGQPRR